MEDPVEEQKFYILETGLPEEPKPLGGCEYIFKEHLWTEMMVHLHVPREEAEKHCNLQPTQKPSYWGERGDIRRETIGCRKES